MNRAVRLGLAAAALAALPAAAALGAETSDQRIELLHGQCEAPSFTAALQAGEEAGNPRHRLPFSCDMASLVFYDRKGHLMVQFVGKTAGADGMIGFAGQVSPDGITLEVARVYVGVGKPIPVVYGRCGFLLSNAETRLDGITCVMETDQGGDRRVAVIAFAPDNGDLRPRQ